MNSMASEADEGDEIRLQARGPCTSAPNQTANPVIRLLVVPVIGVVPGPNDAMAHSHTAPAKAAVRALPAESR